MTDDVTCLVAREGVLLGPDAKMTTLQHGFVRVDIGCAEHSCVANIMGTR